MLRVVVGTAVAVDVGAAVECALVGRALVGRAAVESGAVAVSAELTLRRGGRADPSLRRDTSTVVTVDRLSMTVGSHEHRSQSARPLLERSSPPRERVRGGRATAIGPAGR